MPRHPCARVPATVGAGLVAHDPAGDGGELMALDAIDTGDTVRHGPTGETWLVAYVRGDDLAPCGWPDTLALVSDCTLVTKATPEERLALLRDLAEMSTPDRRRSVARRVLEHEGAN